jgi:hypothetical protein
MKTSGFQTSLSDPEGIIQPIKLKNKQTIEYILPLSNYRENDSFTTLH